ncbi:DNA cytosine methyltransferase [Candidatus Contubernalis alkalaceticus]|nr:DNA cytosine methyltransferase [Candidatus Contubernalis alkalaceticus]
MDLGLENAGFDVIWANDIDKDACETYKSWSNAYVHQGDISKINFKEIPESDVIVGGFPCQGFSLAGPRKINDKRNTLYRYFVKLVEEMQPYAFVAENVKGLLTLGNGAILEAIISDFKSKNYDVTYKLLNAAHYSVPQDRWRVILVGMKRGYGLNYNFPEKHVKQTELIETIGMLPEPRSKDVCEAPFSSRYMSRNRRRGWNEVSYTIPAMAKQVTLHPSSPEMIKLGRDEWRFGRGKTRRFSWQEAAVIQTFPYGMDFAGDLTSKYKQIGNAVPVKLAEEIGKQIIKSLNRIYEPEKLAKVSG